MKAYLFTLILLLPTAILAEPLTYANSLTIESKAFGAPREIRVALPESYETNIDRVYPVIYIARGQSDLLGVLAAINMLDAEVPEFIVVGVSALGPDFIRDEKVEQSKFSQLLHKEVIPYIEREYRAAPFSILVGHSAAGQFVTNDWLDGGNDFSTYYAISPGLNDGVINSRMKSKAQKEIASKNPLLISKGNESKRMQSMFDELEALELLNTKVKFIQFADQTHMSTRVHTLIAGLRGTFDNWRPSRKTESGKFEELKAHYSGLSERYGFDVPIPLETMKRQSAFHFGSKNEKRWQVASDIVSYALSKTPRDANAFIEIADEMIGYGMVDGSKRLISYVCKQAVEHSRCSR